jgi:hypothetical protein
VGWTIPSPAPLALGCLPSSLYTFPNRAWLGITLSNIVDLGFPEFDRFHREVSLPAALDRSKLGSARQNDRTSCTRHTPGSPTLSLEPVALTVELWAHQPNTIRLSERVKGIEPSRPAWKAGALPLSYTRIVVGAAGLEPATSRTQTAHSIRSELRPAPEKYNRQQK